MSKSKSVGDHVPCPLCGGSCVEVAYRPAGYAIVEPYVKLCKLCKGEGRCIVEAEHVPPPEEANLVGTLTEGLAKLR